MSMITLSFDSYEEMVSFARNILDVEREMADLAREKAEAAKTPKPQRPLQYPTDSRSRHTSRRQTPELLHRHPGILRRI